MSSNSSPREGLVPRQITDKNGKQTTVWVRPDDGAHDRSDIPHSLKNKSLRSQRVGRFIDADFVASCSENDVEKIVGQLENNPSLLDKEKYREKASEAYVVATANAEASKRQRDEMKAEILRLVSDDEAARGDVVFEEEKGRIEVTVALEKGDFYPDRANMGITERAQCTEREIDEREMERMFPGSTDEIGSFSGSLDHKISDSAGYKRSVNQLTGQIKALDDDDTDVVTAFANADERYMTSSQQAERMEAVFERYATSNDEYPLDNSIGMSVDEMEWNSTGKIRQEFTSPKTGTVRVSPKMVCSYEDATKKIGERVKSMAEGHPIYEAYSDEKKRSFLENRKGYFISKATNLRVSPDKVKELYPEMYERGRPSERVLYIEDTFS